MATQLFKFVTPRDPQKVTEDTSNTVLDLSELMSESGFGASLSSELLSIVGSETLSQDAQIEAINHELEPFVQSAKFVADEAALKTKFGAWLKFFDQSIKTLTPKTAASNGRGVASNAAAVIFHDARAKLANSRAEDGWLTGDEKLLLLDNLLAHTLMGAQPDLVGRMASIFKLLNFFRQMGAATQDVEPKLAYKWLSMPIGLPKGFKVPSHSNKTTQVEDNSAQLEAVNEQYNIYKDYGIAHHEILDLTKSQAIHLKPVPKENLVVGVIEEPQTREPEQDPYVFGNLNTSDRDKLSTTTQAVVSDLGFGVGSKLVEILNRIVEKGTEAAQSLADHIPAQRRTFILGGQVYHLDDFKKQIADVIWNEEENGGVIIGHGRGCGLRFPFKIANLRIVEQELLAYEPGYIAHIQNTLQGEFNEKTTRRLLRTEETTFSSSEREYTDERDTQSTDRFSMEKETSRTLQEDTEVYVNGELSASYGPVSLSIGAGYANNTSIGESNSQAVSYAKEVVQRSLQRLIEKTKDERTVKTINEFEETNRHGLDNRGGDTHVVGVYRWLDQLNKVTIKTYDKRMMIELMIPQPAKYHLSNFAENKDLQVEVAEPVHPSELQIAGINTSVAIKSHKDLTEFNYALIAANYGATIDPIPQEFKAIATSIADGGAKDGSAAALKESKDIIIPEGYRAFSLQSAYSSDNGSAWANHIYMGGNWMVSNGAYSTNSPFDFEGSTNAITVRWNSSFIGASFHITCQLTEYAKEQWQIKTFNAIMDAYEKKKAAYDNAVAEAKANSGIRIKGTNPAYNKQLIRSELKKQALYLMSHCKFIDNVKVYEDGTVKNCCEAFSKGQVIKFVDSIFEWGNLTYSLYDYFYAKKEEWSMLYNISDPDPLMNNFLRAGEARLIIPVAKGKEVAAMNFLTLGRPYIGDLMSMDILDVADEFLTEEPLEEIVIFDDAPLAEPPLKPLVSPTTLTILECSSGGITPNKYLINGTSCNGAMTPVIEAHVE